jgi:hypothetical protein
MNSEMHNQIVRAQADERLREASRRRLPASVVATPAEAHVCIRLAGPADAPALKRLADLEGRPAPAGDSLVAVVDGRVLGAIGVNDGNVVADPFEHTGDLTARLADARAHVIGAPRPRKGLLARLRRLGGSGSAGAGAPRAAGAPTPPGSESLLIR